MVPAVWLTAWSSAALAAESDKGTWLTDNWPWVWPALATVCLLVVVLCLIFAKYLRISIRLFLDTKMPSTAGIGNGLNIGGEVHQFPSRDGTGLSGIFIEPPPGTPVRGTVVFAHEFNGDRNSALRYTAGLPEMGLRVMAFDFRGHGGSSNVTAYRPSHWVTDFEVDDLLGAIAYVGSLPESGDLPLCVIGVSRGACAAVLAAAQTRNVRALILDGVFSTDLMVESIMKRWAVIFASIHLARSNHPPEVFAILRVMTVLYAELTMRVRYPLVRRALTRLGDIPAFFLYGEGDAYIEKRQRIKVYQAKPGLKQMWEVPGAKHNQAVVADPDGYRKRIVEFLDKHLLKTAQEDSARGA